MLPSTSSNPAPVHIPVESLPLPSQNGPKDHEVNVVAINETDEAESMTFAVTTLIVTSPFSDPAPHDASTIESVQATPHLTTGDIMDRVREITTRISEGLLEGLDEVHQSGVEAVFADFEQRVQAVMSEVSFSDLLLSSRTG